LQTFRDKGRRKRKNQADLGALRGGVASVTGVIGKLPVIQEGRKGRGSTFLIKGKKTSVNVFYEGAQETWHSEKTGFAQRRRK